MPGWVRPTVAAAVITNARIALVKDGDPDRAGGRVAQRLQVLLGDADALEDRARVGGERPARVGQRDRAAVALEQRRAALTLQHRQLL